MFFTLARRDPSKRQIKPVNTETLLLDDLEDESDAEYVYDGNDDDVSEDSESSSGNGNESSSSESGSEDDDSDSSIRIIGVSHAPNIAKDDLTLHDAINVPSEAYPVDLPHKNSVLDSNKPEASSKFLSNRICMLCLGEQSNLNDEIIECDACKIVVHEGNAQREGLLAEPAYEDNPTDPFFAQCRQHTDKQVAKVRRRNYLSAYNRCCLLRQMSEKEKKDAYSMDELEEFTATNNDPKSKFFLLDDRLKGKLEYFRRLYEAMLNKREVPYTRPNKVPLFLENSPVAMRMFMAKAMALSLPIELTGSSAVTEASKSLAPGCPVFCPDFISYVLEREKKIEEYSKKVSSLESVQKELQLSDANISQNYNSLSTRLIELNARIAANRNKAVNFLEYLSKILPGIKASGDMAALLAPPEVVEVHSSSLTADSTAVTSFGNGGGSGRAVISARVRTVCGPSRQLRKRCRKEPTVVSKRAKRMNKESDVILVSEASAYPVVEECGTLVDNIFHECSVCNGYRDQHLLTICDTCKKAFHIACLDPPLTRVPKQSKLFAWQCSMCTVAVVTPGDAVTVDVNAPRQLRRTTAPSVLSLPPPLTAAITPTSAATSVTVAPTAVKVGASAPTVTPSTRSNRSSTSTRRRGKNRCVRLGRPRRVEAEEYPCQMDAQDVVPAEAYPTTMIHNSTPLVEAGSDDMEMLSVSQQLRKVGYGEEGDGDDDAEEDEGSYSNNDEVSVVGSEELGTPDDEEKKVSVVNTHENLTTKQNASDDELASLRGSKVKFVRIKDHESPSESLVDSAPQRYVICQSQDSTPKKSPTSSNFKIKIRKSTDS
ncbi:PHD finger protein 14 [Echinococcus multilocularis]|uniref:PHD finger protein 14 n=1 Tax=Echinococcus multilocularis TaxID=6211 RepID=A0A068Y136_ECHMU|nr:PHD finger protein 14 [Echinococcus multilocularis]